jgi:hypothetical protein
MLHRYRRWLDRRGNVTMFWVVGLAAFFVVFSMVGTLVVAWMQHAYAQAVADAGSLAATKKLDQLVQEELNRALQEAMNVYPDRDPYPIVMGTEEKRDAFMRRVIERRQNELREEVRKYVTKNGGHKHGKIRLPVNGRIEVEARVKYEPPVFQDWFKDAFVKGSGTGPKRHYLKWLKSRQAINY